MDLRAANARRYRDVVAAHAIDLGGDCQLSEAQKALVRRFAMAQVLTELYESLFIGRMDDPDREGDEKLYGANRLDQYTRFAGLQIKLAESLNLNAGRAPRDITRQANDYAAKIIEGIDAGNF